MKQLIDKDYNWLGVFLNGLMKAKIRNEMIEKVSFFDSLSSERHFCLIDIFPNIFMWGEQSDYEGLALSPLAQGWKTTTVRQKKA
jgi:hypothetical protein